MFKSCLEDVGNTYSEITYETTQHLVDHYWCFGISWYMYYSCIVASWCVCVYTNCTHNEWQLLLIWLHKSYRILVTCFSCDHLQATMLGYVLGCWTVWMWKCLLSKLFVEKFIKGEKRKRRLWMDSGVVAQKIIVLGPDLITSYIWLTLAL